MTHDREKPSTSKISSPEEPSDFRPGVTLVLHKSSERSEQILHQHKQRKSRAMANAQTLETLQHATAQLLLMAEEAPPETAEEMREIAARLQALCFSGYFEEQLSEQEARSDPPAD